MNNRNPSKSIIPKFVLVACIVLIFIAFARVGKSYWSRMQEEFVGGPLTTSSHGPTVDSIQRISELMTLRVNISDVLEGEGYGYRGVWIVKGDASFGIDADRIEVPENLLDKSLQSATVVLPRPQLMTSRVNHDLTETYSVERTNWYTIPSSSRENKLRDESMQRAQELIAFAANREEHLKLAEQKASELIKQIYSPLGWAITIEWRDTSAASNSSMAVLRLAK